MLIIRDFDPPAYSPTATDEEAEDHLRMLEAAHAGENILQLLNRVTDPVRANAAYRQIRRWLESQTDDWREACAWDETSAWWTFAVSLVPVLETLEARFGPRVKAAIRREAGGIYKRRLWEARHPQHATRADLEGEWYRLQTGERSFVAAE